MSIGLDFILRANTASFTRGLAGVNNSLKDVKKGLREFDVGNGFKQALGVGGIIAGFRMAINNAQELRDNADKLGKSIDDGTRSVAELGDALGKIGSGFKNGLTAGLSFFTQMGDASRRFFQNVTKEQEEAARKMAEATGKAADEAEARLKKSREENSPEKVAAAREKADKAEQQGMVKGTDAQKKLINLINQRADLEEKISKVGKATTEYQELRAAIAENEKDTKAATAGFDKEALEKSTKINEQKKKLVEKFAPSVEELAQKEVGGFADANSPVLRARKALQAEERAKMLFDRGDVKGGLALAEKAQGIRKGLEMQTGEGGALTQQTATTAFETALTETNTKLDDLTKAVSGIIKSQP